MFGHNDDPCGSQAFMATLIFDPSMSALPIIAKQNSQASDCSPANRERELGLDRRETGSFTQERNIFVRKSNIFIFALGFTLIHNVSASNNMIASVSFVSTGPFTDVFPPPQGCWIFSSKRPSSMYS